MAYHGDEHLSGFMAMMMSVVVASRVYMITEFIPDPDVCEGNDSQRKNVLNQQHGDSGEKSEVTDL